MTEVHAFCRNQEKLERLVPRVISDARVKVFVGGIGDTETLAACLHGCNAVFLCITTNDNVPGCRVAQDTALGVVKVLERSRADGFLPMPKLVLLSSATIDDVLSRNTPWVLRSILLKSASHVYEDLRKTEILLRAEQDWLTTIFIKPGALSVDIQRGHALSLTDEDSPVSYLDLAAAMIEAVNDPQGRYDMRNWGY
ncbi:hypothetical protein PFICI_10829 [Pestalotiopsis fici W106-1]|uniref:uncharacterized protein n=1 Tax=Pestalotiopsis fici (strain W106-1 / CGMCC3.15140) TaxID=1229662 RepID=UPI0003E04E9B|nr:uncharacterized protein PFICI_10829 [Pestalotiopsis fici W106-1]ETS76955.1 hypothetical protein PFICI_10829 [Pestalotiopsis fici W106-1]